MPPHPPESPPLRLPAVLAAATIVGICAALLTMWSVHRRPMWVSDLDQVIVGARVMMQGDNPYAHIGPAREWDSLWPLYYPGPALVLATPLASLTVPVARAVFIATGMFAFTYALLRRAPHCWPMLLSYPALAAVDLIQWAPLLAAATWMPMLGFVAAAKPNIGVAMAAGAVNRRNAIISIGAAAILTIVSLIVLPTWPGDWLAAIREAPHIKPFILRPFGFILLLAALRFRLPEGRSMLALALVPMTAGPQEGLLLASLPRSRKEALLLALISHGMLPVARSTSSLATYQLLSERLAAGVLVFVFLPALAVLLLRANRAERPAQVRA
jgi:hypothetical protein